MPCPIWPKDPAHTASQRGARSETGTPRIATIVTCPVCGEYEVSEVARIGLETISEDWRVRLSWATRQASEAGAPLVLHSGDAERATESVAEPATPLDKANLLLLLAGSRSRSLGERAPFKLSSDWPLICARGKREAAALVRALKERGLVEHITDPPEGIRLTFQGWERLESLRVAARASTHAFVAMWFDASMNPAYDQGFYAALHGLGYDPIRVDREQHLGKIDDFIIASIRKSALLVADYTGMRSGVFFEAGFALGLGIPVVWTCREDYLKQAGEHFDTRQYNHLQWREPSDLAKSLRERIDATITKRPKPRS